MADDTTKQLPANVTALITVDTTAVLTAVNASLPALVNAIQNVMIQCMKLFGNNAQHTKQ